MNAVTVHSVRRNTRMLALLSILVGQGGMPMIGRLLLSSTHGKAAISKPPAIAAVITDPPLVDVGVFAGLEPIDRVLIVFGHQGTTG